VFHSNNTVYTYWIIFKQGEYIWTRFLKKGFGHVSLITKDKFNWIVLDPTYNHLDWNIPSISTDDDITDYIDPSYAVIKITKNMSYECPKFPIINVSPCVSFIRYILGIKKNIITPYKLYKFLINLPRTSYKRYGILEISVLNIGSFIEEKE
jgi:hypothetical protein